MLSSEEVLSRKLYDILHFVEPQSLEKMLEVQALPSIAPQKRIQLRNNYKFSDLDAPI